MSVLSRLNPALANLPANQPGRPIEEVAREHNLPVESVLKLASNENPLGPSPKAVAAMGGVAVLVSNFELLTSRLPAAIAIAPPAEFPARRPVPRAADARRAASCAARLRHP